MPEENVWHVCLFMEWWKSWLMMKWFELPLPTGIYPKIKFLKMIFFCIARTYKIRSDWKQDRKCVIYIFICTPYLPPLFPTRHRSWQAHGRERCASWARLILPREYGRASSWTSATARTMARWVGSDTSRAVLSTASSHPVIRSPNWKALTLKVR